MPRPPARRLHKGAPTPVARANENSRDRRKFRRNERHSKSPGRNSVPPRSPRSPFQSSKSPKHMQSPALSKNVTDPNPSDIKALMDDSDDSDGLVTRSSRPARRGRKEMYMSGGLGKGDRPMLHLEWQRKEKLRQKKLDEEASQRRRSISSGTTSSTPKTPSRLRASFSAEQESEAGEEVQVPSSQKPTAAEQALMKKNKTKAKAEGPQSVPKHSLSTIGNAKTMASKILMTPGPRLDDSVLPGTGLNRRVRQASILEDANDSTLYSDGDSFGLNLDDLEPADESTPLNLTKAAAAARKRSMTPASAVSSDGRASRSPSRIKDSQRTVHDSGDESGDDEVSLPPPRDSSRAPSSPAKAISSTMAPPLSSSVLGDTDNESSEERAPTPEPVTKTRRKRKSDDIAEPSESNKADASRKKTKAAKNTLSTAQLQDTLLPKRRKRRNIDVAEEPEDSPSNSDADEISYLPPGRRTRKTTTSSKGKAVSKKSQDTAKKTSRTSKPAPAPAPATQHHTHYSNPPLSPIATTSRTRAAAKSSSSTKTQPARSARADNASLATGYHRRVPKDITTTNAAAEGSEKENQPYDTSSPLSTPPDTEESASEHDEAPSSPVGRLARGKAYGYGGASATSNVKKKNEKGYGKKMSELEMARKKFAAIDQWSLDFEDTLDGSSPGAR